MTASPSAENESANFHARRDLKVYGWGISLERPTMIRYAISNIRELLGHKVNLNFVQTSPAVRLDKE